MQIVIDMPNENYQVTLTKIMLACRGCSIIELPKGHGRLIDESTLYFEDVECTDGNTYMIVHAPCVDNAPTIIEADKAESEE